MTRSEYMWARQRAYDILCRALGAPDEPSHAWRCTIGFDLHQRAVRILNRLETKLGIDKVPE